MVEHRENPWMARKRKRLLTSEGQRRSPKQEKQTAKRLGGRQVNGSGRFSKKGDVYVPDLLRVESKTTQARSFRVTLDMFDKVERASLLCDEIPAMDIEFIDDKGKPLKQFVVLDFRDFETLIKRLQDAEAQNTS